MATDETPREYWGEYLLLGLSIIPAMIATDVFKLWNVLPFEAWFGIALVGGCVAGAVMCPRTGRGVVAGFVSAFGVFAAIVLYDRLIGFEPGRPRASKFPVLISALVGYAPGYLLRDFWAKGTDHETETE